VDRGKGDPRSVVTSTDLVLNDRIDGLVCAAFVVELGI
jgi:hypothetical protein